MKSDYGLPLFQIWGVVNLLEVIFSLFLLLDFWTKLLLIYSEYTFINDLLFLTNFCSKMLQTDNEGLLGLDWTECWSMGSSCSVRQLKKLSRLLYLDLIELVNSCISYCLSAPFINCLPVISVLKLDSWSNFTFIILIK